MVRLQSQDSYEDSWIRWIDLADDVTYIIQDVSRAHHPLVGVPSNMKVEAERVMWEIPCVALTKRNCHNYTTRIMQGSLFSQGDMPDTKTENRKKAGLESSTVA